MPRHARGLLALLLLILGFLEGRALLLGPKRLGHPVISDECVYLLQAKMLAEGHLSLPSPPLPEFFEAEHLLVVPRLAGKYLPGHPLLLAPFELVHKPWLGPALELGLFAALLFLLGCAAGLPIFAALLAGLLPLCSEAVAAIFGTYLSWTTSLPFTAAALACLVVASRQRSVRVLACASALAGFLFWVRPYTGLAMMFTLAVVALLRLKDVPSRKQWLLAASLPVLLWALLTLLVCKSVTGHYTDLPWTLYAQEYMPHDGPGFGVTHLPPPTRAVPEHLKAFYDALHVVRDRFTVSAALSSIPGHLRAISTYEPNRYLWPVALLGLLAFAEAFLPILVFSVFFFVLQLTFYSPTPFYRMEISIAMALGLAGAAARLVSMTRAMKSKWIRMALLLAAATPLAAGAFYSLESIYRRATSGVWIHAKSEAALAPAAAVHGLVFIRYSDPNVRELNYNDPDLETTALVRALDLGSRDAELAARFPDRPAFVFDVATNSLTPWVHREP